MVLIMRPLSRPVTYIFLLLCVGHLVEGRAEDQQVAQLRTQLEAAKAAEDKPAIIERKQSLRKIRPHVVSLVPVPTCVCTNGMRHTPTWRRRTKWMAPTRT